MELEEISSADRKTVELAVKRHYDEAIYATKLQLTDGGKRSKQETAFLIVGKHRIYTIRPGKKKLDNEEHFLDIIELASSNSKHIIIKSRGGSIVGESDKDFAEELITQIFTSVRKSFPAMADSFPIILEDKDKVKKIKSTEVTLQCGGYTNTYTAICDYFNAPIFTNLCWDIDNLFYFNDIMEFSLSEFALREGRLSTQDIKCMLYALRWNTYFSSLIIERFLIEKEVLQEIIELLQFNYYLEKVVLKDIGLNREYATQLSSSLSLNKRLKIKHFDLSGNSIEDKGVTPIANFLSSYFLEVETVIFSNCKLSDSGLTALIKTLERNETILRGLKQLNLSGNKFETESSKCLASLLAKSVALRELHLAGCDFDFKLITPASKNGGLETLDLSHGRAIKNRYSDLAKFLQSLPQVTKVNLSYMNIPTEVIKEILEAIPNVQTLDLTECNLGDAGVITVADLLSSRSNLKHLSLSKNFDKKTNQRSLAIEVLGTLCAVSPIESLNLAGGGRFALKSDVTLFVLSLVSNRTLKNLDVSRNAAGPSLAVALGKLLHVNSTLESLFWDENNTTINGFQLFRIGLLRNHTLRMMPLPVVDVTACLKGEKSPSLLELVSDIQKLAASNAIKTKIVKEGKEEHRRQVTKSISLDMKRATAMISDMNTALENGEFTNEEIQAFNDAKRRDTVGGDTRRRDTVEKPPDEDILPAATPASPRAAPAQQADKPAEPTVAEKSQGGSFIQGGSFLGAKPATEDAPSQPEADKPTAEAPASDKPLPTVPAKKLPPGATPLFGMKAVPLAAKKATAPPVPAKTATPPANKEVPTPPTKVAVHTKSAPPTSPPPQPPTKTPNIQQP